jgi:hypothetical protein
MSIGHQSTLFSFRESVFLHLLAAFPSAVTAPLDFIFFFFKSADPLSPDSG